jgi:predicted membrane metal-binding protein
MTFDNSFSNFASVMFYGTPTPEAVHIDEAITNMGINHLFVISGFHIALLFSIIDKGLSKVIKKDDLRFITGSSIGLFFLYLIFSP